MSDEGDKSAGGERIAKRMARAGVCSRRDAEKLIAEGRVRLNGKTLTTAAQVVTDADRIEVDGQPLAAKEPTRLWRYHKPAGLVTSHRDEKGRATLFDSLPDSMPRVVSVGRLDLNSEGLLLLTNDGELARRLELPSNGWLRRYRVRVNGAPDQGQIDAMARGLMVEGVKYGPIVAQIDRLQGANSWLTVSLTEGKNREIRRVMEFLGLPVSRLIRVAYGPFQLGYLAEGAVEEVPARVLRDQLGADIGDLLPVKGGGLVKRAQADRETPDVPRAALITQDDAKNGRAPRKPVSAARRPGSTAAPDAPRDRGAGRTVGKDTGAGHPGKEKGGAVRLRAEAPAGTGGKPAEGPAARSITSKSGKAVMVERRSSAAPARPAGKPVPGRKGLPTAGGARKPPSGRQ